MNKVGAISLWKSAIKESLLGQRGLVKRSTLWLPLALFMWSSFNDDLRAGFILSLYLIVAVQSWGMACILVNDLSDIEEDSGAGKDRWISNLSGNQGISIVIIAFIVGLLSIIIATGDMGTIIFYIAGSIMGSLYSMEPVRFKERGILGLLVYSLSTGLIYVLVPWMIFKSGVTLLGLLFLAVMLDKWVNLHFHQIVDYQVDFHVGIRTYAARAGIDLTRRSLRVVSLLASLSMITTIVFIIFLFKQETVWWIIIAGTSIVVVSAVGIYVKYLKEKSEDVSDLIRELPWLYLGLTYLLFRMLPPVIFTYLAIKEPIIWILAAISFLSLIAESRYTIRYKYE